MRLCMYVCSIPLYVYLARIIELIYNLQDSVGINTRVVTKEKITNNYYIAMLIRYEHNINYGLREVYPILIIYLSMCILNNNTCVIDALPRYAFCI